MLGSHFWNLKMFHSVSDHDSLVILNLLVYAYGYFKFKKRYFINSKHYSWFYRIGFAAMFLSAISVIVFHEQRVIDTIFVYRAQFPLLFFPLLFRIQPSINDIKKSITLATIVYIILLYVSLIAPILFVGSVPENPSSVDFGYIFLAKGNGMLCLYLFCFLLTNLSSKYTKRQLVMLCVFVVTMIILQNRQTIIYIFCILMIFLFSKSRNMPIKIFILLFLCTAVLYNFNILTSLYLETIDNTKVEAGRAISLPYFLFDHNENFFIDIIGNGMDSKKSAYGQYLTELGQNHSIWAGDLGIVGIWSIYGILPVIAILYLTIMVIKSKRYMPKYVVYVAYATFLCPYLISFMSTNIYWWAFLLYFYAYYDTLYKRKYSKNILLNRHLDDKR